MPSYINTNIISLNAQRNLNTSQMAQNTAMQRLSSGLRINSAKDDAAGMAITSRLSSQIAGNTQAARNANDGISLSQTAEGDLNQISKNLQRMRDLSVQSANATNTASDRAALNNEVKSLAAEIDRVAQNSSFNGVKLLDGSFTAQNFQIGANATANDSITIAAIASARTSQLGGVGATTSASVTGTAVTTALTAGNLTLNGTQVGASSVGALPGQSAASATSIATAINAVSGASGVTATANSNTVTGAAATVFTAVAANAISINGINVGAIAAGGDAKGQGANAAAAINLIASQTGVSATANATTGALTLNATDGRDVSIGVNGSGTIGAVGVAGSALNNASILSTQLGLSTTQIGTQAIAAVAGTTLTANTTSATLTGASGSVTAGTFSANGVSVGAITWTAAAATVAGTASGVAGTIVAGAAAAASGATATTIAAGTYSIKDNVGGTTANVGPITLAANNTAKQNGDAIALALNTALGANGTAAADVAGIITITAAALKNVSLVAGGAASTAGVATTDVAALAAQSGFSTAQLGTKASGGAAGQASAVATAINTALAAGTGGAAANGTVAVGAITAGVGASTYTITQGTGASVIFSPLGIAANAATALTNQTTLSAAATGLGLTAAQVGSQAVTNANAATHGTVSLSSNNAAGIVLSGGAVANGGFTAATTAATTVSNVSALSAIDISTAAGATAALSSIDGALATVNASRASLGAYQNRFASVVTSLQTTTENLTASRSRIQDTNFAAATAALSRAQILQQAGTAMLAQANQLPKQVLTLLR